MQAENVIQNVLLGYNVLLEDQQHETLISIDFFNRLWSSLGGHRTQQMSHKHMRAQKN